MILTWTLLLSIPSLCLKTTSGLFILQTFGVVFCPSSLFVSNQDKRNSLLRRRDVLWESSSW